MELHAVPKPTRKIKIKKRLSRIRKTPLAKLKREADKLCGDLVRSRGKCEAIGYGKFKCGSNLQWCHLFSRRYQKIRWLLKNGLCMCGSHHVYFTYNPNEWTMFLMKKYQDTYLWLYEQKNKYVKINREFLENTIAELKNKNANSL